MLNIKKNRLDYGLILNPPQGFELERAVATTYSLHLTALLSVPVALFFNKRMDGKASEDRIDIFDAIQKTSDAITVFCQKGKVTGPKNINKLFSFLEESVVEVLPQNAHQSFHPKIWVIRFKDQNSTLLYRVVVLSRNLTLDRSWDIAFYTEGLVGKKNVSANTPVADYVKYLSQLKDFENAEQFIKDLKRANFVSTPMFENLNFYPMGFGNYKNPLKEQQWKELLIVSPFLDKATLLHFASKSCGKKYLFSRKEELDKIDLAVLSNYETFMFSQHIVEGEYFEELQEEVEDERMLQNLHAKIYIGKEPNGNIKWYLGSANCSDAAMQRNEEFVVSMSSKSGVASVKSTLDTLTNFDGKLKIFEPYERTAEEKATSDEFDFRMSAHALLSFLLNQENIKISCVPESEETGKFSLHIQFQKMNFLQDDLLFEFKPYSWNRDLVKLEDTTYTFDGIAVQNLSPFFVFKISDLKTDSGKEFLVKIDFVMPQNRKKEIFKSIIQDKDRFIQLLQFMLGVDSDSDFFKAITSKAKSNSDADYKNFFYSKNMYEEMLLAASRNKHKLKEIERLIAKMKEMDASDLIPEEFDSLWGIFKQFAENE